MARLEESGRSTAGEQHGDHACVIGTEMNRSAVLDQTFRDALFALGMQEGLLFENPERSDYVFRRYQTYEPPDELREGLLEQTLLTPELIVLGDIPEGCLSGRLVEEEVLRVASPPEDTIVHINEFAQEILEAMLQARGYDEIRGEELQKRLSEARRAVTEEKDYERAKGRKPPNLFQKKMQDMLSQSAGLSFTEEYAREEYEAQELRSRAYKAVRPITDCMEEYEKIATIAARESADVRIPVAPLNRDSTDQLLANLYVTENNLILLRLVASELGRIPRGQTLAATIQLSRNPYVSALRQQLEVWRGKLEKGEIDSLKEIQEEVREASAAIQDVRAVKNVGRIATYLSVPISLLGFYLGGLTGVGISVGVVGMLSQLTVDTVERQFRWVMFRNA